MKKGLAIAIAVIVIAAAAVGIYWSVRSPQPSQEPTGEATQKPAQPQPEGQGQGQAEQPAEKPAPKPEPAEKPEPPTTTQAASPAAAYCADDHDKAQTQALTLAGGLVQIFQHQAALADAYDCAKAYLGHGGDIDAADPRADSQHLTPLLFAIKRNDPQMVRFMIDHGADLNQPGGPKDIKPYGYAVYSALHNQSTDYNQVIQILDSSMNQGSDASAAQR
ncbi:ankyrin repeat domain-containing protein [Salinisphaera sp. SPP-AMP-43]|uniref:ankyrin repeat domain-containing protein n=1 Tax=Salinisphaera sp. SPP-AMP-43 TaxID=3121288 RepID=UPI003C6E9013